MRRETISNIQEINVFTGKNDVGKSNVLKALNFYPQMNFERKNRSFGVFLWYSK